MGWRFGTGAGILGAEGTTGYFHPTIGVALAITDIAVPAAAAVVLMTVILLGSKKRCERAFRLLRWIRGCAEPPEPTRRPKADQSAPGRPKAGRTAPVSKPAAPPGPAGHEPQGGGTVSS